MSQEYQYFYEDEIYRIKQNGQLELGMVLENAEFVSSDDESDLDDDDKVTKGNIRVAWYPNGEEKVLSERKVGLCDRSLMPGDVVRRLIRGKDTQRGYCRNVKVSASVQVVGTKFVIASVDSSSLTPLEDFAPDIAVALNSWVGMVNMVKLKIGLVLSDGSRCSMSYDEALLLDDLRDTREKDSEFRRYSFYPGQHLAGSLKLFEAAKWNSAKEKESLQAKCQKIVRATVDRVEVVQLGVRWQCRAFSEDSTLDKEQPKYIVQGEDLKRVKMLNVFEPCTLQLGDGNFYVLKESDLLIPYDQWTKLTSDSLLRDTSNPCPLRSRPNTKQNRKSGTRRNGKRTKSVSVSVERDSKLTKAVSPPLSDGDAEVEESDSLSVSGNEGSSGSQNLRRGKRTPALMTRVLKKRKLRRAKTSRSESAPPSILFKPGDRLVVETLMTTSRADVVWQDGSVEEDIPSTVLFPIHHLDDQEFFPGDLVVEQRNAVDSHEYGVVQSVDHAGRTAVVKWFHTYTAGNAPRPYLKTEQEVSVYDLRDHPDFRYRPGSVVIRVANFDKGQVCSTGQVLDNFPSGQVSVWWVDGSQSLCFPQDLYKVGEYDSDEGELWEDTSSDQSWETESEHSTIAEESETENECQLKTKLVANIEKARIAMSRLEEIFTQNPSLQTAAVIKQLWDCYKECRSIDKLMGTSFFHESNFQGLIERVREKGRASTSQKMAEQFNRLFSAYVDLDETEDQSSCHEPEDEKEQDIQMFNDSLVNDDSNFALTNGIQNPDDEALCGDLETLSLSLQEFAPKEKQEKGPYALGPKQSSETALLSQDKDNDTSKRMKDSKSCNDIKSDGKATLGAGSSGTHALPLVDQRTSHMCAQLCSDMKAQLLKTYEEVVGRFGGHFDMSLMQAFQNAEKMIQEANEFLGSEGRKNGPDVASLATADDQPSNGEKHDSLEAVNVVAVAPTTTIQSDGFAVVSSAPDCHKFKLTMFEPTDPKRFYRTVRNEMNLLRTSLPTGIWVRGFEDRMDLYSVMIRGPERTPYEGGVFFFDFQLSADYPRAPPLCHYVSYCSEKLNPNLYEDGKVCVSLLGTWSGKGTEVWTSLSNLLQVIISIQGLILVSEPYFNEAGYERQKGTQQGRENSRMYNEMVVLKIIQAMTKVALNPPDVFKEEIFKHFHREAFSLVSRLKDWLRISEEHNAGPLNSPKTPTTFRQMALDSDTPIDLPEYPLIPASKGFCITLRKTLENFEHVLQSVGIVAASSNDVEPDSASAQAPLPSGSQVFRDVS